MSTAAFRWERDSVERKSEIVIAIFAFMADSSCSIFHEAAVLNSGNSISDISGRSPSIWVPLDKSLAIAASARYPADHISDGVWVDNQPILVNQSYNFETAFGIEDVGPAIAAWQRRARNEALAKSLREKIQVDLDAWVRRLAPPYTHNSNEPTDRDSPRLWSYGILYGGGIADSEDVRLQTILMILGCGTSGATTEHDYTQFTYVSLSRPLQGDDGWFTNNAAHLVRAYLDGIDRTVEIANRYCSGKELRVDHAENVTCNIGDGEQYFGPRIEWLAETAIMLESDEPRHIAACRTSAR